MEIKTQEIECIIGNHCIQIEEFGGQSHPSVNRVQQRQRGREAKVAFVPLAPTYFFPLFQRPSDFTSIFFTGSSNNALQ